MSVQEATKGYRVDVEMVHATPLIDKATEGHRLEVNTMYIVIRVSVGQTAAQIGLPFDFDATST